MVNKGAERTVWNICKWEQGNNGNGYKQNAKDTIKYWYLKYFVCDIQLTDAY
jgi:hypothetical protein